MAGALGSKASTPQITTGVAREWQNHNALKTFADNSCVPALTTAGTYIQPTVNYCQAAAGGMTFDAVSLTSKA